MRTILFAVWHFSAVSVCVALSSSQQLVSRSQFLGTSAVAGAVLWRDPVVAETNDKLLNLSNDRLGEIVREDLEARKFLVSGDLTRSVYDESATFTDEIDTYGLDQWMKGTSKLFVAEGSTVNLVGDIDTDKERVEFRFDEKLMFRIPFRPVVSLTGRVVLERDSNTGLITSYREFWDQDVASVLKTAQF